MVEVKVTKKVFSRNKDITAAAEETMKMAAPEPVLEEDEKEIIDSPSPPRLVRDDYYQDEEDDIDEPTHGGDDDFLVDLTAPAFASHLESQARAEEDAKLSKKEEKLAAQLAKKAEKAASAAQKKKSSRVVSAPPPSIGGFDDDLFDDRGTILLGRDRLILLQKVKQYKTLFPDKLKSFKIKKNPSISELQSYLDEMEALVDISSVDEFLTESILGCIKIIEGASSYTTNYDVSGLSLMLKANKQFHTLCKQLYIKHGCFSNVPPETQLAMVVITSAYICTQKNKQKAKINSFLNEKITGPPQEHV
jgi:hypothetical protein